MTEQTDRVIEWLSKRTDPDSEQKVHKFAIIHSASSEVIEPYPWKAPSDDIERESVLTAMAEDMVKQATAHAQSDDSLEGAQRYAIIAYTKPNKPFSQTYIRIGDAKELAKPSENQSGIEILQEAGENNQKFDLVQAGALIMKTLDSAAKAHFLGMHKMIETQAKRIAQLEGHCLELEETHIKTIRTYSDLMDRKVERDIALEDARHAKQRNTRLYDKAEAMLPMLLAKLTGFSGGHLIQHFFQSLTPDQFRTMASVLLPEQRDMLKGLISELPANETQNGVS